MNLIGTHLRGRDLSDIGENAPILLGPVSATASRQGERLEHIFAERAASGGGAVAVIDACRQWTYAEIDACANQVARMLIDQSVKPGDRVALLVDRSAETYIIILAILKAGAVFVPLATAFPDERMALILEDANVTLLVTIKAYADRARGLSVPHLVVTLDREHLSKFASSAVQVGPASDDLCYILYTSGTTGRPKGVAVAHRSICNFVRVAADAYGYRPEDRVYQGMTIAFDFSTEEIWVPFAAGATIVPAPGRMTLVGEELAEFLRANEITCMACSPTLLSSVESDVPSLRAILVGGEHCPQNLVQRWWRPDRQILNTYGPTEATVTATMCYLTPDDPVTIGMPLPTYSIVLLDPESPELASPGDLGEIGIAGIGLAVGYLNRPDLTEQKFIPDFIGLPNNPSHRIYRTGDLGRINEQGDIEYHGRIDTQVKIRGYRIELSEIESVLLEQPSIAQAAVTTWEIEPGRVELVGYYAYKSGVDAMSRSAIAAELRKRLPDYMVPSFLEELPSLPMTVSDKVDTRKLPRPVSLRVSKERPHVPPSNDEEQFITNALSEALNMKVNSIEDHFFDDLGANSLLLARFCAKLRMRKEWATTSMRDIYMHPSVASLAQYLKGPEEEVVAVEETYPRHRASNIAYWACGSAQLLFYCVYAYADLWLLNRGLNWVYDKLDDPAQLYARCALLSLAIFFGMSGFAILMKWLLIGRWKPESIPIWSLRYYRFWVVKTLIQTAPVVLFRGSPLYSLYLRLLGARLGDNTTIECRSIPVCTDLISIGDNSILRKESMLMGYRAQSGYIHTGPISIGDNAFVGMGCMIDIDTSIGNRSQLGHASSLLRGQRIPDDQHWHGSPASQTTANYCPVPPVQISTTRRILYEIVQVITLFVFVTPIPLWFHSYWQNVSDDYQESIGVVAIGTTVTLVALFAGLLAAALILPRLFSFILRPNRTYKLYGFHFWLQSIVEVVTNARLLNLLFGDSSAIVHYIRALGWKLNKVVQTGSNFGSNQQQDNPLFCEIGSGTMVSDGLYMINVNKSATAFRLEKTKIGERNYLGNNIFYPPNGRTGENVLLGTKVMIPVDGPMRENVGLLGSPPFEIPRIVQRDVDLIQGVTEDERRAQLPRKNRHNAATGLTFFAVQWIMLFSTLAIWDRALNYYTEWGHLALFGAVVLTASVTIVLHILIEWTSLRFRPLKPNMTTIYDISFWRHERHWKLADSPVTNLFTGTPFRPMILRALGVKMGKRVYDGGANLTERSLVEIGDDVTLNEGCVIQAHSLEEGAFKSDHIRIGNGCTLATGAFIHYGVVMQEGSTADLDCFIMKGEILEKNSIWRGNPGKLYGFFKALDD
ncbi:Pls/PosA family non-ribosomal peptide synthetase [Rhizobium sp. FKY42]|uniref:Pls/PosA family non-ribosomal peptide synthetase n=1 Tax=Rhizobium sp. FKY42 TaxID=2562310 RepID=UPI0010C045FA|nr:Pls/PosA family non-ribosomal peptide synthetase [Rhizobium sp. FKY42]